MTTFNWSSTHAPGERRNLATRVMLMERIRSEFREMPCMALTLPQASRLFGLPEDACARVLQELMRSRQLATVDEQYRCV